MSFFEPLMDLGSQVGLRIMNRKKPDALVILAILFGLGVLISAISHGGSDERQAVPGMAGGVVQVQQ